MAENTTTATYITNLQTQITAAIQALNDVAVSWTFSPGSITEASLPTWNAAVSQLSTTELAKIRTYPTLTGLQSTPEEAPVLTGYNVGTWDTTGDWNTLKDLLDNLNSSLLSQASIDAAMLVLAGDNTQRAQNAIFANDLARKQQILRDRISAAASATGAAGFTYPTSMTKGLELVAHQEFQMSMDKAASDITVQLFEWAKANYNAAISNSIEANKADMDFNIRYAAVVLDRYRHRMQTIYDNYKTQVMGILSEAELYIKEYTATAGAKNQARAAYNSSAVGMNEVALKAGAQMAQNQLTAAAETAKALAAQASSFNQTVVSLTTV